MISETDKDGKLIADYIFVNDRLTVKKEPGGMYFYNTDPAGSPLVMTDTTGAVVWQADYRPFGESQLQINEEKNNRMFVGKEADKETGLYYFGARYMKARTARFVEVDPVGAVDEKMLLNPQRLNRYAYGLNNPYRYVDPDGKVIEIVGRTSFKNEVQMQLNTLKKTSTGKGVVESLYNSKNIFTIKENMGSSRAEPLDDKAAQNGKGTGGTIKHDPKWNPKVNTVAGIQETPAEIVLGHELHHATDYDNGTLNRNINPSSGVRRSEEAAVGTENRIRKELGISERIGY